MLTFMKMRSTRRAGHTGCLNLFAALDALRTACEDEIICFFRDAYQEDPDLAMKTMFFVRDPRQGMGERRVFHVILKWLAQTHPDSLRRNLPYIAEFGRWEDVLELMGTPCEEDALALILEQLDMDFSMLADNAHITRTAKRAARLLRMDDRACRKLMAALRGGTLPELRPSRPDRFACGPRILWDETDEDHMLDVLGHDRYAMIAA